jgi:cysteine-rich repeat protein
MTVARISLALLMGLGSFSCSCQDTNLAGDTDVENGIPDYPWDDTAGMPDLDWIFQEPRNEEMPEFVMDADPHDPYSEDAPPEPWVPDFWDVDFDYMDVPADYEPDPEFCGNGVVDPGEECDDGNDDDNDACTSQCLLPRCGDGSVWYAMEDCDPPGTVRPCMTDCGSTGREWCMPFCRWEGECIPPVETCGNGEDDDCDGIVDTVVRLCPNVAVSDGPIGSHRSKLAWSSSEFLVMWASADGATMLSRLDPWGRKTAWDWIVNNYFQGLVHLAWAGAGMGTFLAVPGYESDNYSWFSASHLFFQPLDPAGNPLSDFVVVAITDSPHYNLGGIQIASSEAGHGVMFHRYYESDDPVQSSVNTSFMTLSPDGAEVSAETVLGRFYAVPQGASYDSCFFPTAIGYAALKQWWPDQRWELEQITRDGTVIDTVPLPLPIEENELPLLTCAKTDSNLALVFYYRDERRILLSLWAYDGTFVGSQDVFIDFDVNPSEEDFSGFLIEVAVAGDEVGLFWTDTRDGNQELYFSRIGAAGALLGGPARLTHTAAPSRHASAVWDGEAYGVTWWDSDGTDEDIYFTRLAPCP